MFGNIPSVPTKRISHEILQGTVPREFFVNFTSSPTEIGKISVILIPPAIFHLNYLTCSLPSVLCAAIAPSQTGKNQLSTNCFESAWKFFSYIAGSRVP